MGMMVPSRIATEGGWADRRISHNTIAFLSPPPHYLNTNQLMLVGSNVVMTRGLLAAQSDYQRGQGKKSAQHPRQLSEFCRVYAVGRVRLLRLTG